MCKSIEGVNGKLGRTLDWVRWGSQVLVIPLLIVFGGAWWDHERRIDGNELSVVGIEKSRFTASDGLVVWQEIAAIQADVNAKADVLGATPVLEDIAEIKAAVREQALQIASMQRELAEVSTKLSFVRANQLRILQNGPQPDITEGD